MTGDKIDPFDEFYCMSKHDPAIGFAVREIYKQFGDKTCVDEIGLFVFGSSEVVGDTAAPINPWGENEVYQTSNVALNMSSSSASDTAEVTIKYLYFDVNGDMKEGTQTKTLTGQTPVTLDDTGCRWNSMFMSVSAVGNIYLYRGSATNGVPNTTANIHNQITPGNVRSQKASISIPYDTYFIVSSIWADTLRKQGSLVEVFYKVRKIGNDFLVQPRRGISDNNSLNYKFNPYAIIGPNSDIGVDAIADQGTDNIVTSGFEGYYAKIIS